MDQDDESLTCIKCGEVFSPDEFDDIDDEFNEERPYCPSCQESTRIEGQDCEYCNQPAQYEADGLYLCDSHYDDYLEHHPLLNQ
jgi:NAD-dependent SIR2 family protein deacetylase